MTIEEINEQYGKPNNFLTAKYIAEKFGYGVSDEQLKEVAILFNFKFKPFKSNYQNICALRKMMEDIK